MSLGSQIEKYRKQRGMTQNAVAEKLEVTFQAVSSWEHDQYAPDITRLSELAEALGTTVPRLLDPSAAEELPERQRFSSGEHMYTFLKTACRSSELIQKALPFAREAYAGQTLPGTDVPLFDLPLTLACHAFAMKLTEEDMTAALLCLLPDGAGFFDGCPETVKGSVRLFERFKRETGEKQAPSEACLRAAENDPGACLVILLCAVHAFSAGKRSARETAALALNAEKYVLPLAAFLKRGTPEENSAAWLLSHELMEKIELIRRFL